MKLNDVFTNNSFRKILIIFLIAKIVVFASGYLGYFLIPAETTSRQYITDNPLTNPWAQFDGKAYLDIAERGYNAEFAGFGNYGFFPLYPLMIKAFSFIGYDVAALLISNIFSFLAIVALYIIIKEEYGEKITEKTIFYMLFFPTAYFFSVMYTESLFLFLAVVTFIYARRGNWAAAGMFGFLASLTRIQGVLLFLPVAYLYAKSKNFELKKTRPDVLFTLVIPLGAFVFFIYLYLLTGDLFIQQKSFAGNYTALSFPWQPFISTINGIINAVEPKAVIYHLFNVFIAVGFLALSLLSFRYLKRDYSIYFLSSVLLPFFAGHFVSITRYVLPIFPAFIMLSLIKDKKFSFGLRVLYIIFIIMLVALTIRHANMHLDPYGL